MSRMINSAETAVDCAAAAIFAAAVAFACVSLHAGALAILLAPVGFGAAFARLRRIHSGEDIYPLAHFEPVAVDPPSEDSEQVNASSEVVRLFDPRQLAIACPSGRGVGGKPADASQALSAALAQVRRSLR